MNKIEANIEWHRRDAVFVDQRYHRTHRWRFDGGTQVPASSSPDIVPLPMSSAAAVDPEEAFVAALSSCHMLWFLSIAAKAGFVVDRYADDSQGELKKNGDGRYAIEIVTLRPDIRWAGKRTPTDAEIDEMHRQAHEHCFIANSVKTSVRIQNR